MRVGLIARWDTTGLGVMTTEFFANMRPDVTVVLDFTALSRGSTPERWEPNPALMDVYRYADTDVYVVSPVFFPQPSIEPPPGPVGDALVELLTCDVIYSAETFYWWWLVAEANRRGVRTVLHYMYEHLDYLLRPDLPMVTELWAPTPWYLNAVERAVGPVQLMRVPVSDSIPTRTITEVNQVVHVAGNLTSEDRNGTEIFMAAKPLLDPGIEVEVFTRYSFPGLRTSRPEDYRDLCAKADALVMPRRFGGLCLPQQEAMAAGMAVFMSDMEPQDDMLHLYGRVPVEVWGKLQTKALIQTGDVGPVVLAEYINRIHREPMWAEEMAEHARTVGAVLRWSNWQGLYRRSLAALA